MCIRDRSNTLRSIIGLSINGLKRQNLFTGEAASLMDWDTDVKWVVMDESGSVAGVDLGNRLEIVDLVSRRTISHIEVREDARWRIVLITLEEVYILEDCKLRRVAFVRCEY
eukprot:TRINITY_DN14277_c0_g1_i3.p2 TRINITY_DN14277_c0_g1~~TRINITY_DN14277_c0_g1_i3.p2  ORF type:complete len:112 (+),score=2.69 TRINITY_DN14277_c0_g1_i3:63-398(+)